MCDLTALHQLRHALSTSAQARLTLQRLSDVCGAGHLVAISKRCSATRLMAGQRQPDGRSLRTTMMAWLTCRDKQRCRRSPLCGEHLTVKKPVDLCITQARYTQLQPAHQQQPRRTFYHFIRHTSLRQSWLRASAEAAPLLGGYGTPLSLLLSPAPLGLRGARAAATFRR